VSGRAVWAGGGRRALQRWRQPPVGVSSVLLLLVVMVGLVLGAGSLGGWGGLALVVAVLVAVVALVYLWCDYPGRPPA